MATNSPNSVRLLTILQCSHSILNTAWPRPGVSEMRGAGIFIGTNLFDGFEKTIADLQNELKRKGEPSFDNRIYEMVELIEQIVQRLKCLGRNSDAPLIDKAFNLLYFATGILYHAVAAKCDTSPTQDERFSRVEEIPELIDLCRYPRENQNNESGLLLSVLLNDVRILLAEL